MFRFCFFFIFYLTAPQVSKKKEAWTRNVCIRFTHVVASPAARPYMRSDCRAFYYNRVTSPTKGVRSEAPTEKMALTFFLFALIMENSAFLFALPAALSVVQSTGQSECTFAFTKRRARCETMSRLDVDRGVEALMLLLRTWTFLYQNKILHPQKNHQHFLNSFFSIKNFAIKIFHLKVKLKS